MANLPNIITFVRILLIPVLVVLLTSPSPLASVLATVTFFLACLSDFLDGYLARRWGLSTTLGKLLDPLADKLIVAAALIMLAGMERMPSVPSWMVVVIMARRAGSLTGHGRRSSVSTMLKIVELAPMPSAKESMATAVKPGFLRSIRKAKRRSCQSVSNHPRLFMR